MQVFCTQVVLFVRKKRTYKKREYKPDTLILNTSKTQTET